MVSKRQWEQLLAALEAIASDVSQKAVVKSEVTGLISQIKTLGTAILSELRESILKQFNMVSKTLQGVDTDTEVVSKLYDTLNDFVNSKRECFDAIEESAKTKTSEDYKNNQKRTVKRQKRDDESREGEVLLQGRDHFRNGLRLRQLTDGRHLVQMIYAANGDIQDCEYISEKKTTRNFLKTLRKELKQALDETSYKLTQEDTTSMEEEKFFRHFGNVTFRILKNNKLPPDIESWLDYSKLKMECLRRHEELKYMVEHKNKVGETALLRSRRSVRENFIVPGTKWCGAGQLAQEYNELGSDHHEDRCCRAHDNCRVNIGAFKRKFGYFNFRPFTVSHCKCDRRGKRDAMDILRIPGTKWCGKGFSATRYSQLGGYSRTDRCCRMHDLRCPFWIPAMENKYGLYNWRVNTLMHCRCDERFRACLKLADTPVSNMVGKLFFNVVQSKCFVLKPVKVCVRRSWWGRCLRKGYAKQAFLRDNLPY
ncbi:hypothetical protein O0L34_g6642 [Tuta absoluta]|nr:hypothetical protein O0L34_g6642 [Tuta absoluta]